MNQDQVTTYDRLMRAWENSMELNRDFEMYSKWTEEDEVKDIFKKFAEDEGMHASQLRSILSRYHNQDRANGSRMPE